MGPALGVIGRVNFDRVDIVGQTVGWGALRIGSPSGAPDESQVRLTDCRVLANVGVEPSANSGLAGEETPGGVVMIGEGLVLESVNTDWGTGAEDNTPSGDVTFVDSQQELGTEYIVNRYSWDGVASFTCDSSEAVCE